MMALLATRIVGAAPRRMPGGFVTCLASASTEESSHAPDAPRSGRREWCGAHGCDVVGPRVGTVPGVGAVGVASVSPSTGGLGVVVSSAQGCEVGRSGLARWTAVVGGDVGVDVV